MADMGEIGLAINDKGAVVTLKAIGKATDELSDAEKRQNAILKQLAQTNLEMQNARKAEQTALRGLNKEQRDQARMIIEAQGGMQRYLEIQKAITRETQNANVVKAQNVIAVNNLTTSYTNASNGAMRFRGGLTSLVTSVIGLNPQLMRLGSVLGMFALGSGVMVGILAGVAAIGFAWNRLTEDARKLKEASDKAVLSLQKMHQLEALGAGAEFKIQRGVNVARIDVLIAKRQTASDAAKKQAGTPYREAATRVAALDAEIERLRGWVALATGYIETAERQAVSDWADKYQSELDKMTAGEKAAYETREKQLRDHLAAMGQLFSGDFGAGASFAIDQKLAGFDPTSGILPKPENSYERDVREAQYAAGQRAYDKAHPDIKPAATKFVEDVSRMSKAAAVASQSLEYYLVSRLGGGGAGGSLGAGIGKAATAGASAFGSKAWGEAIFGPAGAALGAIVGNFIGGLLGSSSEERAKIRQTRIAFSDMTATMEILRQKSLGANTALLEALEANRKYYQGIKDQIDSALPGTRNEAERNANRAEADAFAAKEAERIKADYARTQQEKREDLEVRALLAQKKDKEAEALRRDLGNKREIQEAEKAGMDAAYIARLKEVQAIETTAAEMNKLTTSMRNAPSGFKAEPYINRFAAARPWDYNGGPMQAPFNPLGGPTSTGGAIGKSTSVTIGSVSLVIPKGMKPEDVGPAFMQWIDKVATRTVGSNAPVYEAMDYAPRS